MSTLSQFAPFAGGGIKSIQTGYVAVVGTSTTSGSGEDSRFINVTISAVNTAKSVPAITGSGNRQTTLQTVYVGQADFTMPQILPRLTSSTNLRLSTNCPSIEFGDTPSISGRWYVVESN
jgi:hypothetical protein